MIRGFARIGAVVAVLVALIGGFFTISDALSNYNYAVRAHDSAQCVARLARNGYTFKRKYEFGDTLDYEVGGCSDSGIYGKAVNQVIAIADAPAPTFFTSDAASTVGIGLIITGVCALVIFFASWCIGWVFAGFTRDA